VYVAAIHDSAGSSFAVFPSGDRVLVNRPVDASIRDRTSIALVTGWAAEVARSLAAGAD
jgi:hypothetical protein